MLAAVTGCRFLILTKQIPLSDAEKKLYLQTDWRLSLNLLSAA